MTLSVKRPSAVLILLLLMITGSCKKYDDGPWFSIYSKTERVTGNWRFALVREDGEDVTEDYARHTVNISRGGDLYWSQGYIGNNPWDTYGPGGEWRFVSNREQIEMHFFKGVREEFTLVWDIKRLAYGDLRIERYDNGRLIEWRMWKPY